MLNNKKKTNDLEHIAIIMDGNRRWARARGETAIEGHRAGLNAAKEIIKYAARETSLHYLTLFAFSTENWQRPPVQVAAILELFYNAIVTESELAKDLGIKIRFIGDLSRFSAKLQQKLHNTELTTASNPGMTVIIALNYGGRWDIINGVQQVAQLVASGQLVPAAINESVLASHLSLAEIPDPDLLIRTSGESRISNFLLWNLAYTELYFTECLWPDFRVEAFKDALAFFTERQRRFGADYNA